MRRLLALLILCLAPLLVCCHMPPMSTTPFPDMRTNAERAEDRSVALVHYYEGANHAFCSGVWVASNRILTAFHCIKDNGRPRSADTIEEMLRSLGADLPPEMRTWVTPWDPTGQLAHYTDRQGATSKPMVAYDAMIIAVDPEDDLALLETDLVLPKHHDIAPISARDIHDGDEVDMVGSTAGFPFTYSHGYVSATRAVDDGASKKFKTLQISIPIWGGNSGGGALDDHGFLIGIADFVIVNDDQTVPCMGFFIHRDVLVTFLNKHQ